MLDEVKDRDLILYRILKKSLDNDRCLHAYLFDTSSVDNKLEVPIMFAKSLFCPGHYTNGDNCQDCRICKRIDDKNFPSLVIIEPDGIQIKKDQVNDMKYDFSMQGIEGDRKICIIQNCEKLNKKSGNSLLKFLEEPESDIIVILTTDYFNQVLTTIVSRCQILKIEDMRKKKENQTSSFLIGQAITKSEDKKQRFLEVNQEENIIEDVIKLILKIELCGNEAIVFTKKYWLNHQKEAADSEYLYEIMKLFYIDCVAVKNNCPIEYFGDYIDDIKKVSEKNETLQLLLKVQKIMEISSLIRYNINSNLLIDKLIIVLGGIN